MIEILLLSATFMIVIFIGIMVIVINFKRWFERKDILTQQRIDDLTKKIDDTQTLFKTEITEILTEFKKLLK